MGCSGAEGVQLKAGEPSPQFITCSLATEQVFNWTSSRKLGCLGTPSLGAFDERGIL